MFTNIEVKPLLKDIFPHCTFLAPDSTSQPLDFKTTASVLHNYFEPKKEELGVKCELTQKGGTITLLDGYSITPSIQKCAGKVQDREGKLAKFKIIPFKTVNNKDFRVSFLSDDSVAEFLQAPSIDVDTLVNPDGPSIYNLLSSKCPESYFDQDTNDRAQARKSTNLLAAVDVTLKVFEESITSLTDQLPDIKADPGIKTLKSMLQVTQAMATRTARAQIEQALSSRLLLRQKAFRPNMQHHYERILKSDLLSRHIAPMKELQIAAKGYHDTEPFRRDFKHRSKSSYKQFHFPEQEQGSGPAQRAGSSKVPRGARGRSSQLFRRGRYHGSFQQRDVHHQHKSGHYKSGYYKRGSHKGGYRGKNLPSHSTGTSKAVQQPNASTSHQ